MFLKNLLRRKIRTLLTVIGIAIGVAAIISLGALANGLDAGYGSMLQGSKADLILSQPDAIDISYSTVDESIGQQLLSTPEVAEVSGLVQGIIQADNNPYFFVFGHTPGSFALDRYHIIRGAGLDERLSSKAHGKPVLLGSAAAEVMKKAVGDTLRLSGSVYRIQGIYETGDAFEDSGAVLELKDAQELLGRPRTVGLYYIRLKDPSLGQRFLARAERQWPDLLVSGAQDFVDSQNMAEMMQGYVWAIGGLAIVIGGIGMMNTQLMSVMERTREIGVLRAVGWSKRRVLWMILAESLFVSFLGGLIGIFGGYALISLISQSTTILGLNAGNINPALMQQALSVVLVLGLVGGLYPAWRASRMAPVEALRYEGGSSGQKLRRLPVGGMAIQGLWQRSTRTILTLLVIGLTVGAIIALEAIVLGVADQMQNLLGSNAQIMLRQADVSDSSMSAIDERIGDKIAALPEVLEVNGLMFTASMVPETGGYMVIMGYEPRGFLIQRIKIVEGESLTSNHQILLGKSLAEAMSKSVGDTIDLSGYRFRVAGIYESKISWEELGAIMTLRDAQSFMGRPGKVTIMAVQLHDPSQAPELVERINQEFPEVHATLAGEFVNQMPDMQATGAMIGAISFLAILVGGVGVLNTMLMSVFERTREIGVLRALGWRRRRILGLILRESLLLGLLGGFTAIAMAFGLIGLILTVPYIGQMIEPQWTVEIFIRAIVVALSLGVLGGLYPAFRATRLQPVEALRYE
jgi:ABC-type antimicrobial peptide transport system permease subunit